MAFLAHNRRLMAEIERLEHKSRRPTCWWMRIYAFYDAKLPEVLDIASFEAWRKAAESEVAQAAAAQPRPADAPRRGGITTDRFPSSLGVLGQKLKLSYLHEPRPTTA